MTNPVRNEELTALVRDFIDRLRTHFQAIDTDVEREQVIDRILAVFTGAIGLILSLRRKNDETAAGLLAVALRLWTRRPPNVVMNNVVNIHDPKAPTKE